MKGKNILYICDYAAKYTGSFVPSLTALAKAAGVHNQIYFLFPDTARDRFWLPLLPVDQDHIFFADFSVKNLAAACTTLARQLHPRDTVVHTHFLGDFRLMAVRLVFPRIVCHYHMMVPMGPGLMKRLKRAVRRLIYRDMVIVGVSEAVTKDATGYFPKAACVCIPNAVDFERLDRSKGAPVVLQEIQPAPFRILIHGSDFVCKGVDVGLGAIRELEQEYPGAFHVYMTSNDVERTQNQIRDITQENLPVTVIQSLENIKSLYDSVDLYISPSREEAFSFAVVEASYCACQVAASDIPGQNTMKPVPGIIWFGKDDVAGLKKAILMAKENQVNNLTASMKKEQKACVQRMFQIEEWVERNLEVYRTYFGQ